MAANGEWKLPSQLLYQGKESKGGGCFDLGFSEVLLEMTSLDFIHELGQSGAYSRQLLRLGANPFKPDHLLHCLDAEYWLAQQDDEWFKRLFAYLQAQSRADAASWNEAGFLASLAKKRIFPVENAADVKFTSLAPMPTRLARVPPSELRQDLVSREIAAIHSTPLFFVQDEEVDGERPEPPPAQTGLLVLCQSIGPNEMLSSDYLKHLGLLPATKFAVVMALLGKVEEAARSRRGFNRPWSEAEHSMHVAQVQHILFSLESLAPEERQKAMAEARKSLHLHVFSAGEARKQPLEPVTRLYLHSASLQALFEHGRIRASFVNSCYFRGLEKNEVQALEVTLSELGAAAGPKLVESRFWLPWHHEKEYGWGKTVDRYDLLQYKPGHEMEQLINSVDPKVHEELLALVDRMWDSYYRGHTETTVTRYQMQNGQPYGSRRSHQAPLGRGQNRGRGRGGMQRPSEPPPGTTPHDFKTEMQGCPLRDALKVMPVTTSRVHTAPVCLTYLKTESLVRVLGESVPFMTIECVV